jgi:hypothetical protein
MSILEEILDHIEKEDAHSISVYEGGKGLKKLEEVLDKGEIKHERHNSRNLSHKYCNHYIKSVKDVKLVY